MTNVDKLTKYVLAIIQHTSSATESITYYSLKSKGRACAFAEAAIKSSRAENVYYWLILVRDCKIENAKGYAFYKKVIRVYPNESDNPAATFGTFDGDFSSDRLVSGNDWGYLSYNDIR